MKIDPTIFKAYDIRGTYPDKINEEVVYKIGRAFVGFLQARPPRSAKGGGQAKKIVVGRDMRLSSPALAESLIKGITEQGAEVIDIDLSSTPMMYFSVANYGFDGGINITASHNPKEYNGLKLVREKAMPISGNSGLVEIKEMVVAGNFESPTEKGKVTEKEILNDYLENAFKFVKPTEIANFKIVVDTANAMAGLIFPKFFERLNCQVIPLFWELDGSFPNHLPDPLVVNNLDVLRKKIIEEKADLGIATDGDADRVIFIDERGKVIRGDFITALIARMILKEQSGQKILFDIRSSRIVKEVIEENGGQGLFSRIGHSLIKEQMNKEEAVFAGEVSGHYYLKDNYNFESPFVIILYLLRLLSQEKKKISQIIEPLKKYYNSGEINFEVKDKEAVLKRIEQNYHQGKINRLDGITVQYNNWWFNLRPSNTEPLVRLNLEAKTEKLMKEKLQEISQLIKKK